MKQYRITVQFHDRYLTEKTFLVNAENDKDAFFVGHEYLEENAFDYGFHSLDYQVIKTEQVTQ